MKNKPLYTVIDLIGMKATLISSHPNNMRKEVELLSDIIKNVVDVESINIKDFSLLGLFGLEDDSYEVKLDIVDLILAFVDTKSMIINTFGDNNEMKDEIALIDQIVDKLNGIVEETSCKRLM